MKDRVIIMAARSSGYGQSILAKMPPNVKVIAWYYDGPCPVCALDELRAVGAPIGFAVYKENQYRNSNIELATKFGVDEIIYTSFRFFRNKNNKTAFDLCVFLDLGVCIE